MGPYRALRAGNADPGGNPSGSITTATARCSPAPLTRTVKSEPLPWRNSTLLEGDAVRAVAGLKEQPGQDIVVLGSGGLIQSLMQHNLVDEFVLLIYPLVLGSGRQLFRDGVPATPLRLVDSVMTTTTGVIIATYQPASAASR